MPKRLLSDLILGHVSDMRGTDVWTSAPVWQGQNMRRTMVCHGRMMGLTLSWRGDIRIWPRILAVAMAVGRDWRRYQGRRGWRRRGSRLPVIIYSWRRHVLVRLLSRSVIQRWKVGVETRYAHSWKCLVTFVHCMMRRPWRLIQKVDVP